VPRQLLHSRRGCWILEILLDGLHPHRPTTSKWRTEHLNGIGYEVSMETETGGIILQSARPVMNGLDVFLNDAVNYSYHSQSA